MDGSFKRGLYVIAAVLLLIAFLVSVGWVGPNNVKESDEAYRSILALGLCFGFVGLAVK